MKNDTFKQCRFKKGNSETIAFIPAWAAVTGNKVELLSLDGDFWTVTEASEKIFSKDEINERGFKDFQKSLQGGGIA